MISVTAFAISLPFIRLLTPNGQLFEFIIANVLCVLIDANLSTAAAAAGERLFAELEVKLIG
jgi:uncharacterized protein (DUF2062 family)